MSVYERTCGQRQPADKKYTRTMRITRMLVFGLYVSKAEFFVSAVLAFLIREQAV